MALNFANNNSLSAITSLPASISGGALTLLETQTASSSATISFTSGIDSTYKEYIFKFIDIHPATDGASLTFNGSSDSGSNYNVTKTTSVFRAYHQQDGGGSALGYRTSDDLAQSTSFQILNFEIDNDADSCGVGTLHLFNPSDTTFVKHFIHTGNSVQSTYTRNDFVAGYFNTTSVIDAIQFKMSSGNIDSGTIKLYGVT
jgi:hypothetical protein